MTFEFYKDVRTSEFPQLTITTDNNFTFNKAAFVEFELSEYSHAMLAYDKEQKKIAFKLLKEAEFGARKIVKGKRNCMISGKGLLKFLNIEFTEVSHFRLEKEDDFLVIQLLEEIMP